MKHKHRHIKKKPLFDDYGSRGGGFTDLLDDPVDSYFGSGSIWNDPYSTHNDLPIPKPSPNPKPFPDPYDHHDHDNHHDQDDDDNQHAIPPHGVSWSREKSSAIAATSIAAVAAGGAAYYGANKFGVQDGLEEIDSGVGDVELTEQPTAFSEFVNDGSEDAVEKPIFGEDEEDPELGDGMEDTFEDQPGDIPMQDLEEGNLTEELGEMNANGNRTFTFGDDEEIDAPEEIPEAAEPVEAAEEEGFWESAWEGIKGFFGGAEETAKDVGELAENLPEMAGAAAEEAGASEGVAAVAEAVVEGAEVFSEVAL